MGMRLRQHLSRTHEMLSLDDRAKEMKCRARTVLCQLLHEQPIEIPPAADQVQSVIGNVFFQVCFNFFTNYATFFYFCILLGLNFFSCIFCLTLGYFV